MLTRQFKGTLKGHDQSTNIILANTKERIITEDDEPTQIINLGLYLVRGDCVAVCGLVDDEIDQSIDWTKVCFL